MPRGTNNALLALLAVGLEVLALVEIDPDEFHGIATGVVAVGSIARRTGELDEVLTDDARAFAHHQGFFR